MSNKATPQIFVDEEDHERGLSVSVVEGVAVLSTRKMTHSGVRVFLDRHALLDLASWCTTAANEVGE